MKERGESREYHFAICVQENQQFSANGTHKNNCVYKAPDCCVDVVRK